METSGGALDTNLYYKDNLHLIKEGNSLSFTLNLGA